MSTAQWDALQQAIPARDKENKPPEATANQEEKEGEAPTAKKPKEASKHPEVENPMKFDSTQKKTNKQHYAAWAEHQQNLDLFQCKCNLIQACLQDLEKVMPSELIANLCDEDVMKMMNFI